MSLDLGVKIIYMIFMGSIEATSVNGMYHELSKISSIFYYLEKSGEIKNLKKL